LPVITTVATEPITTDDWYFEFADGAGNPIADPNTGVKDVDDYVITFKAETDGNYKEAATPTTATWSITQKVLTAEMFTLSADVTYSGAPQKPTISTGDEPIDAATDYTIEVKDSKGNPADIDNLVDADTYTFNFIAKADGNYKESASKTWTIGQKDLTDEMFALEYDTKVYNGQNQKPEYTFADGDPSALVAADFGVTAADEMVDAAAYTFKFTAKAEGNYSGEIEKTFTITQDEAEFVLAEAENLTYNGKKQTLVTPAETDAVDGVVKYAIAKYEYDENENEVLGEYGELSEDMPQMKDAGKYSVKTQFTASETNYSNPEEYATVDVTINKANIGYMLGGMTKVWDGEAITEEKNKEQLEKVFTLYAGELFEDDIYDVPFTLSLPEDYRDAGTHTFAQAEYEFKEGYPVNYKINFSGTGTVQIDKADIVEADFDAPGLPAEPLTFTGEEQEIVTAGTVKTTYQYPEMEEAEKIGTIWFAQGETIPAIPETEEEWAASEVWSTEIPAETNAGDYPVWYVVKGDKNHNNYVAKAAIPATIGAKAWDAVLAMDDEYEFVDDAVNVIYNRSDFMPTLTLSDGETVLEKDKDYTLTIKNGEEDAEELKDAGTYVFTYTAIGNYEGSETVVRTITIDPRSLEDETVVLSKFETPKAYNQKDQKPGLSLTYDEIALNADEYDVALSYKANEEAEAEELAADAQFINAGIYTFTFTGKGNFADAITADFTITKLTAIAQAEDNGKNYDGYVGLETKDGTIESGVTFGGLLKGDDAPVAGEGAITLKDASANVGDYEIVLNTELFESVNYEVVPGDKAANFNIAAVGLMVNWNTEADPFTKVYGAEDPELTASADNLVITGAVNDADKAAIIANTVITRAEGENVGTYAITLAAKEGAEVFNNYNAAFEGYASGFEITKAELIVSLAPQTVTYTGETAVLEGLTSEDLVVSGLIGDDDKDVVTSFEVEIPEDAVNAGDYQISVVNAEAADYEIKYLPATLTIDPVIVNGKFNNKPAASVGADAEAVLATVEWELVAGNDAEQATVDAAITAKLFVLEYNSGIVEDGKIASDNGQKALVIVYKGEEEFANFIFDDEETAFGDLALGGEEGEIALDDSKAIETFEGEGTTTITFTQDRVVNDNVWQACVLPCTVSIEDFSDAFGYAAVDVFDPTRTNEDEVHFCLKVSGNIEAGVPFLFKTNNNTNFLNARIEHATLANTADLIADGKNIVKDDDTDVKFIGTFEPVTLEEAGFAYLSSGAWYKTVAGKKYPIKSLRAYLDLAGTTGGARIFIEEPDGTVTGIDAITLSNNSVEGLYNLNGIKVNNLNRKGVFIQNGKKVIKK
jgi:hypothetical protein